MATHNISGSLNDQDMQDIRNLIAALSAKMPFLITMTNDQKRQTFKFGTRSMDFIKGSLEGVNAFPDILPRTFKHAQFSSDAEMLNKFSEIHTLVRSLCEKVDDTYFALGGNAMKAALDVYTYIQTAAPTQPGLKSLAERLKARFKKQKAKPTDASF